MNRNLLFVIITASTIMLTGCSWAFNMPEAMITIRIIDESGEPIKNATVRIGFAQPKKAEGGIDSEFVEGITDSDGQFIATHKTIGQIGYEIKKSSYYGSYGEYTFKSVEQNRLQPWNKEFKVVLRKIENPVPMYARDSKMSKKIILPIAGVGVGFDLIEYDWVKPFGKGANPDLIIKMDSEYVSAQDYSASLTIYFTNKYDGIQIYKDSRKNGSEFKLPRYAPEHGYLNKLSCSINSSSKEPTKFSFKEDDNYFIRVRSEEKDGKLYRAMYGKIHGGIEFYPKSSSTAVIIFKYYLNPDYSRNLEYDPKRNLFTGLGRFEYVGLE